MTDWRGMSPLHRLNLPSAVPFLVNGKLFISYNEAAVALGCTSENMADRLNSQFYPSYQYVSKKDAESYLQTLALITPSEVLISNNS